MDTTLMEILKKIYNPFNIRYYETIYRNVIISSTPPAKFQVLKVRGSNEFIRMYQKFYNSGLFCLSVGLYAYEGIGLLRDRFFFDCEKLITALHIVRYLMREWGITPLVIYTGGRGYHVVVFVKSSIHKRSELEYLIYKIRAGAYEHVKSRGIYGLDLAIGLSHNTYHVVPYTLKGRTGRMSCIATYTLKCADTYLEALRLLEKAIRKPLSI